MKTSELIGRDLNEWVARAEGVEVGISRGGYLSLAVSIKTHPWSAKAWTPSTDAAQGQPIMERERIATRWDDETLYGQPQNRWLAEQADLGYAMAGPTMLIAGMRARVAQVYGDEVPA